MTDEELIAAMRDLSAGPSSYLQDVGNAAADRIEALVRELATSNEIGRAFEEDAGQQRARVEQLAATNERLVKEAKEMGEGIVTLSHDLSMAEARAERLEAALKKIAAEASVPVHTWENGINFKKMYEGWRKIATTRIDIARAALKGDDHE